MATDIAMALGVLALIGSRVHPSLKLFLLALAIVDDIGAIVVIAFFYSQSMNTVMLPASGALLALAILMRNGSACFPLSSTRSLASGCG